jgi:hypothetical protein
MMAEANRTDLNNPARKVAMAAAKGQTYGAAAAQMESQRAVPMGQAPSDVQAAQTARTAPGGLGSFNRPTERPEEPLTAGANFGPGPNMLQAGVNQPMRANVDNVLLELQELNRMFPNEDLTDLIDSYVREGF